MRGKRIKSYMRRLAAYWNIFGLWVDRNRVDVIVEILPATKLPPPPSRGFRRRVEIGSKAAWGGFWQGEREKRTDIFVLLTGGKGFEAGGWGFETGGGGRLWDLPHGRGKAEDTFSSEKTGFSLLTETLSSLEPIWSLKYLSFLSTTLYGPRYSWEIGGEEAFSRTNTNSRV